MPESVAIHPLPALPCEDGGIEKLDFWDDVKARDCQAGKESRHRSILHDGEEYLALFDDTSEFRVSILSRLNNDLCNLNEYQHEATPLCYSKMSPPTPQLESNDVLTCDTPPDTRQANEPPRSFADYTTQEEQNKVSRPPASDITSGPTISFHRNSLDTVIDFVPGTTPIQQCNHGHLNSDPLCDASTDEDAESHRTPLVRFADTHTILCTPPPPSPPPHRTISSPASLSAPTLLVPTPAYSAFPHKPHSLGPYGPRLPPWGSTENLDRERRLRTDLRVLEDILEDRFDEDARQRARERRREEEEVKMGMRRTEGEELREAVQGIYPEIEAERERKGCCCSCEVM